MFASTLFVVSALASIVGALMVAISKNLMHACMFLLLTLGGVAGLYLTLGADFVAAIQLIVYVGGVVILMLFAVMLTGGVEDKSNKFGLKKVKAMGSKSSYILGSLVGLAMLGLTYVVVDKAVSATTTKEEVPAFSQTVEDLGELLLTDHVLAFEFSSVLLLGALVGAAVIARPAQHKFEKKEERKS